MQELRMGEVVHRHDTDVDEVRQAVVGPLRTPLTLVQLIVLLYKRKSHRFEESWRHSVKNLKWRCFDFENKIFNKRF